MTYVFRRFYLILIMVLLSQPADATSFQQALLRAYRDNPDILVSRAELDAVKVDKDFAQTGYQPDVSASFSAGLQSTELNGDDDDSTEPTNMSLDFTQPIFRGGTTVAELREANENIRAQSARMTAIEQDVLLQAATAYVDVLAAQSVLDLNQQNVRRLGEQLKAEQEKFRVGESTRTDVSQAKARLARAKAAEASALSDLNNLRSIYQRVVGEKPADLTQPAVSLPVPTSIDEALNIARDNAPELVAAEYIEKASNERVRAVWGQLLPQIDVTGSISRQEGLSGFANEVEESRILLRMNVPIYRSGRTWAEKKRARHVAGQRRAEIIQTQRALESGIVSIWEDHQSLKLEIDAFKSQVNANSLALEGVREEARLGTRTTLDILDAEQEYLDSKVSLIQAERDYFVSKCRLLRQIGWFKPNIIGLGLSEGTENS